MKQCPKLPSKMPVKSAFKTDHESILQTTFKTAHERAGNSAHETTQNCIKNSL